MRICHSALPSYNAIALARYLFVYKITSDLFFSICLFYSVTTHDLSAPLSIYGLLWVFVVCPQTVYDFGVPSAGLLRWEVWQVRCTSGCQQIRRKLQRVTFFRPAGCIFVGPTGCIFLRPAGCIFGGPAGFIFLRPAGCIFVGPAGCRPAGCGCIFVGPAGCIVLRLAGCIFVGTR